MGKQHTMLRRISTKFLFTLALLLAAAGARAADYIFTYNGGYLAVGNNGAITYTNTFSPQCVWTCVSSATREIRQGMRGAFTVVSR